MVFYGERQTPFIANLLLSFISNKQDVFYDAREEDLSQITSKLKKLINETSILKVNGIKFEVYGTQFINQYANILRYSETFHLYLKNRNLYISPSDLEKISSWLNDQWKSNLKLGFNHNKSLFESITKFLTIFAEFSLRLFLKCHFLSE